MRHSAQPFTTTAVLLVAFLFGASGKEVTTDDGHAQEEGDDEHEEEEEASTETWAATIFAIFLFLVIVTIAFERGQEYLLESSTRQMRPVVKQM